MYNKAHVPDDDDEDDDDEDEYRDHYDMKRVKPEPRTSRTSPHPG
jgi:hypothetical protein